MGTVRGDLHDIGKNLVGIMVEGAGYEITTSASIERREVRGGGRQGQTNIVGMSALLTTTMTDMKTVIDGLQAAGRDQMKMASAAHGQPDACQRDRRRRLRGGCLECRRLVLKVSSQELKLRRFDSSFFERYFNQLRQIRG